MPTYPNQDPGTQIEVDPTTKQPKSVRPPKRPKPKR